MKAVKNIMCFGDSNTWGYAPITKKRFDGNTRWTAVLQTKLGDGYRVIEEGLNGRTTVHNEKDRPFRSGADLLPVLLETHAPLDLVIVMLGTNDLKTKFNSTPKQIAKNVRTVCELVINNDFNLGVKILLVSPTKVVDMSGEDKIEYDGAIEKSSKLGEYYEKVAQELNVYFLNAAAVVDTTIEDGIHWNEKQHSDFALKVSKIIASLF